MTPLRHQAHRLAPALLPALMLVAAAAFFARDLMHWLPPALWLEAALRPHVDDLHQVVVHDAVLPRMAIGLLCGAALGLAGTIFQQVLQNPLAEPATLGISTGAYLAIAAATFFAPELLAVAREEVALAGAATASLLVFLLAGRPSLSPVRVILAGLVVNLACGAAATTLALFHDQAPTALFLWVNGSLVQRDWSDVTYILPRLSLAAAAALLISRPLTLAGLDDAVVGELGLSPAIARLAGLVVAVLLTAFVVSAVGNIGFVGLAAPALARFAGARTLRCRLFWAPLTGAALLWLADEAAMHIGVGVEPLPAGAATAIVGAPLLVLMLLRLRPADPAAPQGAVDGRRAMRPGLTFLACLALLLAALWLALDVGQGLHGWTIEGWSGLHPVLPWHLPRIAGALAAGAMLAAAGCILQRLTGNAMASPEVLGIGAGSVIAVIALLVFGLPLSLGLRLAAAALGAIVTLAAILAFALRSRFTPERTLLVGIAVNTLLAAIISLFIGSGDPRALPVLRWISGSTYLVSTPVAVGAVMAMVILLGLSFSLGRWLAILPLGAEVTRAVGVGLSGSRFTLLAAAALLTTGGTFVAGPTSFVGLMAPHMAAMLGLRRPLQQLYGGALLGAALLILADWIGRMALFPNELPAGLVASLIGAPYFAILMRRRAA